LIIIGILLLVIALAALGFVAYGSADAGAVTIDAFGLTVETSVLVLFLSGVAALLLAVLGLLALRAGARRSAKRRSEIGRLRRVEVEAKERQEVEAKRQSEEAEHQAAAASTAATAGTPAATADHIAADPTPANPTTADPTTAGTSQGDETTLIRRDPAPADAPFGREPASTTVTTSKHPTNEPIAGATASDASSPAGEQRPVDPGHQDRL